MAPSENPVQLIDFLYKDLARIDSFYAQLFNGTLRDVTLSSNETAATATSGAVNIHFAKGSRSSTESHTNTIQKRIDPQDNKILDILRLLSLNDKHQQEIRPGHLCLLSGSIAIRDYKAIQNAMPIFFNSNEFVQLMSINKQELKKQKSLLESLLKLIPMGMELELNTSDNKTFLGMIKPEFLVDNADDLLRTYGTVMPGEWWVLGIADKKAGPHGIFSPTKIRQTIDSLAVAIRSMYDASDAEYTVLPIVIFRKISHQSVQT